MPDTPKSSPILRLDNALPKKELAKICDNFSAIVLHEDRLWLGGDEGTSIDLMIRDAAGDFGSHQRFDLEPLLKLPDGTEGEIDIEGLDVDGGYLWLIGSHSLKRKKPDEDDDPEDNIDRLSSIDADGNRFTLGRVPFTNGPDLPACSEQWWLDRGTPGRERARQSADEVVAGRSSHWAVRSPLFERQVVRNPG